MMGWFRKRVLVIVLQAVIVLLVYELGLDDGLLNLFIVDRPTVSNKAMEDKRAGSKPKRFTNLCSCRLLAMVGGINVRKGGV